MIKLFSMFSGYGGAEFGLKKAGINYECVGYSEIDKGAIKCYNLNFPNVKNYGDCSKIDTKDLGFWVDGFIQELNLVIEIDEKHHFDDKGNLSERDINRQREIENKLNCKFLRIKNDE